MPNIIRLGRGASRKIQSAIDDLYDKVKVRFLGPNAAGKRIFITFDRSLSLPGIFEAGSTEEAVKPDLEVLASLIRVAQDYLDASRERMKAKVIHSINGALAEAKHTGGMTRDEFRGLVNTKLSEVWSEAANSVHTIVDTEINHTKNVSILDGIVGANLRSGIEDPTVYFVVVRDEDLCDECKRLHLMPDGKTPRLWKLSEVSHGYHKKGEDSPSIGGLHPHCRCSLVTLMPGYGFNAAGFVTYKKFGFDAFKEQRELERSEYIENDLFKTEPFDPEKHPRDSETGEFTSQAGSNEALSDDPGERARQIAENDEIEDWHNSHLFSEEEEWENNVYAIKYAVEEGIIQPNSQAIEKAARSFGTWPEDPAKQQQFIREVLGLSKAQAATRTSTPRAKRPRTQMETAVGLLRKPPTDPVAKKVHRQALVEHMAAPVPEDDANFPIPSANLVHLYRGFKFNPSNAHAQALRYAIHRIENAHKYDNPASAKAADQAFVQAEEETRDRKGAYVAPYGLFPLYNLRAFIAHNPRTIQELIEHKRKLDAALAPHTINVNGVPHVPLVRYYPHPHRSPELVTTSYTDIGPSESGGLGGGSSGVALSHPFHNLVPLKNIWYSYDFGPREAFLLPYRNSQGEFVVSPHELVEGNPAHSKKLFPSVPVRQGEVEGVPKEMRAERLAYGKPSPKRYAQHAAGGLIMAKDTGRVLVGLRGPKVNTPNTWGTWGGAIHPEEDPVLGALREIREETGYNGPIKFKPLYTAEHPHPEHEKTVYHNLLGVVDREFDPKLNWEHSNFAWVHPNQIPRPMHYGLKALLNHPEFIRHMIRLRGGASQ